MEITGANGQVYAFEPADITMLSQDGSDSFIVFGLRNFFIRVMSDLPKFMDSLSNKADFVQLTFARNGHDFWANVETINTVDGVQETDRVSFPLANARLTFNRMHGKHPFFNTQDVDTAVSLINAVGGSVS